MAKEIKWKPIYHTFSQKCLFGGQKQLDLEENIEETA
jgi:hypothetical protein